MVERIIVESYEDYENRKERDKRNWFFMFIDFATAFIVTMSIDKLLRTFGLGSTSDSLGYTIFFILLVTYVVMSYAHNITFIKGIVYSFLLVLYFISMIGFLIGISSESGDVVLYLGIFGIVLLSYQIYTTFKDSYLGYFLYQQYNLKFKK